MPNQLQIECFFKSSDLVALCENTDDIIITCNVTYSPDAPPTFEITADAHPSLEDTPPKGGCPRPCP